MTILKQITMRRYKYTIEEMLQIINEFNEQERIIKEYKEMEEMEDIEFITEEEMTDLFGSRYFGENLYWFPWYRFGNHVYTYLTDYEQYQLDNGYDPILGDNIEQIEFESYFHLFDRLESLQNLEDISDTD